MTVTENAVNDFIKQIPASFTLETAPQFILKGMEKTAAGKQALAYAAANNGSFAGFIPTTPQRGPRRELAEGFRFCTDCEREALAANATAEDAKAAATKRETEFARVGKNNDGTPRYGTYCKVHSNKRAAKYAGVSRERQRFNSLPEMIEAAQLRVKELEAELEQLSAKYEVDSES